MRKLVLILIAFIAVITFIQAVDHGDSLPPVGAVGAGGAFIEDARPGMPE